MNRTAILVGLAILAVFLIGARAFQTAGTGETSAQNRVAGNETPQTEKDPAEELVLNIYSSRHYDTDERLYTDFETATGIKVQRIEDNADALMARMEAEGANSHADILLTTDVGRLWAADQRGLFQAVQSDALEATVPAHLRHPDGHWFGFSKRARVVFYDKARVDPNDITSYLDLADPKFKGLVCTRSSSNIYMLSLMASMIQNYGEEKAKAWAEGVYANRARDPEGGDTDQLRGIVSGQCGIALANTYYFARALRKNVRGLANPDEIGKIGVIFPDQDTFGAHVNISGGGVAVHAPHKGNAVKFLEYLAGKQAQTYFAEGNDEYPVVAGIALASNVASLGSFKEDSLNLSVLGINQPKAQAIYDAVGYK